MKQHLSAYGAYLISVYLIFHKDALALTFSRIASSTPSKDILRYTCLIFQTWIKTVPPFYRYSFIVVTPPHPLSLHILLSLLSLPLILTPPELILLLILPALRCCDILIPWKRMIGVHQLLW